MFTSWRIVIVCTNIVISTPSLISRQNDIFKLPIAMNSFKVIVKVTPNALTTYVGKLYPEPISDKEIVKQSAWPWWPNEPYDKWCPDICRQGVLPNSGYCPQGFFGKHSFLVTEWEIHCKKTLQNAQFTSKGLI